jgi:hypothetical protein
MSTLEWRREQPRVEPPRYRDWFKIVCEGLSWYGVACGVGLFIALGDWFFLAHALFFGNVIAREFH